MQQTHLQFLGNAGDLPSIIEAISSQFPDVHCVFREKHTNATDTSDLERADVLVFHWKSDRDRPLYDSLREELQRSKCTIPVIVVAEGNSPETALYTLRNGAVDCLCRPFNIARLIFLVGALTARAKRTQCKPQPGSVKRADDAPVFLPSSIMRDLMDQLQLAARSDSTILLMGETGTGKNRLATYVHHLSTRRHAPMVTVDCGAASETLIESELFGHRRGAFTGADQDHIGKLERVGDGTVLLDEVDCLPLRCQTRLLRVLEERVFEKVGDERTRKFGGRVIALTNKSLDEEIEKKRFRKDLYYRLNVISFTVPGLRERPEDIPALAMHFVEQLTADGEYPITLSDEAVHALVDHAWPGNVRELRNVLERALALCDSTKIRATHLDLPKPRRCVTKRLDQASHSRLSHVRLEAERRELLRVLEDSGNNRTHAAKNLGISRAALYKRLSKLGLI